MDLLAEHVGLRLDAYRRRPDFRGHGTARAKIREHLAPIHEHGEARTLRAGGRLDAVVAWRLDEDSWYGPPVHTLAIDHRRGADVEAWLRDVLAEVLPLYDAELDLVVDAAYPQAYRALLAAGVGVDSVQLLGDVARARRNLRAGALPEGVVLDRLRPADVDALIALYAETFAAAPEYCWFGAYPKALSRQRDRLEVALLDEAHLELVLRTKDGPRGHASATVVHDNAFWGPTAGMSLCFAPELRGRGVLRPVYRALLDGMHERGAVAFKGGTSQPAVMRLALEMGRTLSAVNLRRRAHFDEAHFAPFLPLR